MAIDITLEKVVNNSYKIFIEPLSKIKLSGKVAIVTNPKVSGLHLKYLLDRLVADELYIISVQDGEEYKNQKTIDYILDNLLNHKFNRKSTLIAFGGGVIGDMTGFTASIYQRGINFIQIPTTLLSQVDASVGGKTGMNNSYGKNLVGAFHQPQAVHIDTHFLSTLESREFGAGFAEIVKMAVTFDAEFFEWLEWSELEDEKQLKEAIERSVKIKADVVAQDEKEKGLRAALNYGHTFAHVIEKETEYKKYLHGEAVSIGICMANRVAVELGWMSEDEFSRIRQLLKKYDLPTTYNIKDIDSFFDAFFLDKKSTDNSVTFIIAKGIGSVEITNKIDNELIKNVLTQYSKA
ncbi:MAG: 3-dehydroquinate synthase [Helicobacteraceae bacterium]|nr:3-dehydroquinate synthase [Helicobacteraceae bacterium]